LSPNIVRYDFPTHLVLVDYGDNIYFNSEETRKIKITIYNNGLMNQQMWCTVKVYAPEDAYIIGGLEVRLQLNTLYGQKGEAVFEIDTTEVKTGALELLFDISFAGRHTNSSVKALLLRGEENTCTTV